jgi:hypothetical protein
MRGGRASDERRRARDETRRASDENRTVYITNIRWVLAHGVFLRAKGLHKSKGTSGVGEACAAAAHLGGWRLDPLRVVIYRKYLVEVATSVFSTSLM